MVTQSLQFVPFEREINAKPKQATLTGATTMEIAVTPDDIKRIEGKLDKMASAVEKLIIVEERQTNQTTRLDRFDLDMQSMNTSLIRVHARIDRLINLSTGASVVIVAMFELARFLLAK